MLQISRETMRNYLINKPLVNALRAMTEVNDTRKALNDALKVMEETNIDVASRAAVTSKLEEYKEIAANYDRLIEDSFDLTWQKASILVKYLDHDLDRLPEYAKS